MIPRSRTREPEAIENQAKRCSPSRGRDRPDLTEPLRRLPTEMTETHSSSAAPPLDPSSAVTVMDVAREAGVSTETVQSHGPKLRLLQAAIDQQCQIICILHFFSSF